MRFKVMFFAPFKGDWEEFVPAIWGGKAIRHDTKQDADERISRLEKEYPNDKFKVESVEA